MIRLTDEEIKEAKVGHVAILVAGKPKVWEADRFVAKAQLKKVIQPITGAINVLFTNHPSECMRLLVQLRQALLEEVKE